MSHPSNSNNGHLSSKYSLITTNLQEVLGDDIIRKALETRALSVYWGTATTGKPHIGYCVPIVKIGQLLQAECTVTILLADVHAALDNLKASWDLVNLRVNYYKALISAILTALHIPTDRLRFVKGTDFQLSKEYILDVYKMSTLVSEHDAKKAGSEVVKQVEHPLLSGLLYPCLQALDEEYLNVDAQFGGVDQRKIFTFAEKYLPQLGYTKRAHLMNPMVPGLTGAKMSSSDVDSKIDFMDPPKAVEKKIKKAFCKPGSLENNGVLSFVKMVIFPILGNRNQRFFSVCPHGGPPVDYESYEQVEADFVSMKLHPGDLKAAVTAEINSLLKPIQETLNTAEMKALIESAYPSAVPTTVKAVESPACDPSLCDFRVGRIVKVGKHPNADSLFVEEVDVGLGKNLTICSGLVGHCSEEELLGNNFVFLVNLKPANLRGIMSEGMIMCGKGQIMGEQALGLEPLIVPAESQAGESVYFDGFDPQPNPAQLNAKKKVLPAILAELKVGDESVVVWKDARMMTRHGLVGVSRLVPGSRVQ